MHTVIMRQVYPPGGGQSIGEALTFEAQPDGSELITWRPFGTNDRRRLLRSAESVAARDCDCMPVDD